MTGNNLLRAGLCAVFLTSIAPASRARAAVLLIKDSRAVCTIVAGEEDGASLAYSMDYASRTQSPPSRVLTESAADLAEHLNEMGQIWKDSDKVPVVTQKEQARTQYRILLGSAAVEEYGLAAEARALPYPGYICRVVGNDLLIFGSSSKGTANGIYGFLQDELGVRWFGPQADFRVIPTRTTVSFDTLDRKAVPSMFGVHSVDGRIENPSYLWGRRMRQPEMVDTREPFINASHNLNLLFPIATYAKEHPEYYYLRGGVRQTSHAWAWGLCWSNPDIVTIAADKARAYFRANPQNQSFSLGINDTNAYCECPECAKLQPGSASFRGSPVASDMYYHFVNEVARAVKEEFPDRFLGVIAYNDVTWPPSGPMEKNIHVGIVTDVSEYFDPKYRAQEEELIRAWQQKGITLGMYYYLGLAKLVPAYFPHLMDDVLKDAHQRGFTGIHSEVSPGWPWTGPMAYLESRLLWNIDRKADDLLREYFTLLYGPAAKPMEDLYRLFEAIHLRPRTGGFLKEHYQFIQFRPYTKSDLQKMRQLLSQAHDSIPGLGTGYAGREGKEGQRVAYVSNGLKVFLDMLEAYTLSQELKTPGTLNNVSAMAQLESIQQINAIMKRHAALYRETILADKTQSNRYTWDTCRSVVNQWKEYCSAAVAAAMVDLDKFSRSAAADPLVKQRIERELTAYTGDESQRALFQIKTGQAQFGPNLIANGGFEEVWGEEPHAADCPPGRKGFPFAWNGGPSVKDKGVVDVVETDPHTGRHVARIRGTGESAYLLKPSEPLGDYTGLYLCEAWAKNMSKFEGTQVYLEIRWYGKAGWMGGPNFKVSLVETGKWSKMEVVAKPPEGATQMAFFLFANNLISDDDKVFFDDAAVRRIKDN